MKTPDRLADCLSLARGAIRNTHIASGYEVITNTRAGVQTLRSRISPTPAIMKEMANVLAAATSLFNLLNNGSVLMSTVRLEEEKERALATIDQLERALPGVQPSDEARDLGLDW